MLVDEIGTEEPVAVRDRAARLRAIVLLLRTRLDYLPTPKGVSLESTAGAAASERGHVACGCASIVHEAGRPVWRGSEACLLCGGTGFRSRLAGLDVPGQHDERGVLYDPYTYAHDRVEKPVAGPLRVMDAQEYDREIARLQANVRARAGVIGKREAHGWERARDARDRSGSYAELERALEALRGWDTDAYSAVVRLWCEGRYGAGPLRGYPARLAALGLMFLEGRMPEPVKVPQYLTDQANGDARTANAVRVYRQTGSLSKTAHSLGMRKARVRALLRRAGVLERG